MPRAGRRSRRGGHEPAADGETLVRAVVHARLLGVRLLTLDARVVVGAPRAGRALPDPDRTVLAPVGSYRWPAASAAGSGAAGSGRAGNGADPTPGLARAVALLEQGADTLARTRRTA